MRIVYFRFPLTAILALLLTACMGPAAPRVPAEMPVTMPTTTQKPAATASVSLTLTPTPAPSATQTHPEPAFSVPTEDENIFTLRNDLPYNGRQGEAKPDWVAWGAEAFSVAPNGDL